LFFYAAKLVWFILQPSVALLLILIGGLLLVAGGSHRLGGTLAALSLAVLIAAAFLPLGPALLFPLERRFAQVEPTGPVTGIIVLGGGLQQGASGPVQPVQFAHDRVAEAVRLAQRFPEARVVFSGGSGDLLPADGITEAQAARAVFMAEGVSADRLTIEDASRNTAENATLTAAMVDPKPGETWLLVTSAYHMPRAMGCVRAAGFDPQPWPTGRLVRDDELFRPLADPARGFSLLNRAAKEWVGLVAYRLTGRTDALFPR
jgi:uncharacterized SAM-binding protein YcdF (DUF218 family)